MLKHHKAARVLYIFLPHEISKISAGIPSKAKGVERSGNDFIYSALIDMCLGGKNIVPALGDAFGLGEYS